jgi:hypothetical protein
MNVKDLIAVLSKLDGKLDVVVDSSNYITPSSQIIQISHIISGKDISEEYAQILVND